MAKAKQAAPAPVVQPWLPWWGTWIATFVAVIYMLLVFGEAEWPGIIYRRLHTGRTVAFFSEIARLFADRSTLTIDFRAEAFRCDTHQFEELDLAPYFPMHAGDKENRFDRTMFFYLNDPEVHQALEDYIISRHNARVAAGEPTDLPRIGGIELLSLRIPIPPPGSDFPRFRHIPLSEIPKDWKRVPWYLTGLDERMRRCAEGGP